LQAPSGTHSNCIVTFNFAKIVKIIIAIIVVVASAIIFRPFNQRSSRLLVDYLKKEIYE